MIWSLIGDIVNEDSAADDSECKMLLELQITLLKNKYLHK